MQKTLNVAALIALLFSALALSACATKPKEVPVAEPVTAQAVAEEPPVQEAAPAPEVVAAQPEAAPAVTAEQPVAAETPAFEPVAAPVKKKVAKAKRAAPKVLLPLPAAEPVVVPPPTPVETAAPVVQPPEPSPPQPVAPPAEVVVEKGFLEQYWLWLVGLVIAVAGIVVWRRKSQEG